MSLQIPMALLFLFLPFAGQASTKGVVEHRLKVILSPASHTLAVEDVVTLPEGVSSAQQFYLHKGLHPASSTPGVDIKQEMPAAAGDDFRERFHVRLPPGQRRFTLRYEGQIFHPLISGQGGVQGESDTAGVVTQEGVYLSGNSYWYPVFDDGLVTFTLETVLPLSWDSVSQGGKTRDAQEAGNHITRWESPAPQEEIYLLAAPWTIYHRASDGTDMAAYLHEPDQGLADKYLDAAGRYLQFYSQLIGPYPYPKFALVENFWESGYGMPSFTLIGPRVLRLPFIINGSFPHEILHDWWGNGVYVDLTQGNWSEGLTAYMADHLMEEANGRGGEHRQALLQKYRDFVGQNKDFPLSAFHARHSVASEAVGYGKALMFFHMLRLELGDEKFLSGLRTFYRERKFRRASYEDMRRAFEKSGGRNLRKEFAQWTMRAGAPELRLSQAVTEQAGDGYRLRARLQQIQPGEPYRLNIPVAVTLDGESQAVQRTVPMNGKVLQLDMTFSKKPVRLDIDPQFDIFRRLDASETPPALSQALAAEKVLVLLPAVAEQSMRDAYRRMVESWYEPGTAELDVRLDKDIDKIPEGRAVWVLGWENEHRPALKNRLHEAGVEMMTQDIRHTQVFTVKNGTGDNAILVLLTSGRVNALPGLARKLPHYHKYSYLVFEGDEPVNIAKGRWSPSSSALTAFMSDNGVKTGNPGMGRLAERSILGNP